MVYYACWSVEKDGIENAIVSDCGDRNTWGEGCALTSVFKDMRCKVLNTLCNEGKLIGNWLSSF